jgi:hypothetical protein
VITIEGKAPPPPDDIAAWLLAHDGPIAEAERLARDAQGEVWYTYFRQVLVLGDPSEVDSDDVFSAATQGDARHIAHWSPARVLAECAAVRRIVAAYRSDNNGGLYGGCGDDCEWLALGYAMQALAQPYAGWPGWREEWTLR